MTFDDAVNYFIKVIENELGLRLKYPKTPHAPPLESMSSQEIKQEGSITITPEQIVHDAEELVPPLTEEQKEDIKTPIHEPEHVPTQSLINFVTAKLSAIKEELLEKISSLEARISRLEQEIQALKSRTQLQKISPTTQQTAQPSFPTYPNFQTSNIDLLLHEARELLETQSIDIIKLVRLEAIEWQLLKAFNKSENKNKIPTDFLKRIRLEINRLRKALLE